MKARVRTVHRFTRPLAVAIGLAVTVGITSPRAFEGQNKAAAPAQKMDDEYTKKIVDNTPDKRILTELVDHMPLPADPKVPSPLKLLGYIPGENGQLTYSKDVFKYLDALDEGVRAREAAGRSARPKKAATRARCAVADEATIANLAEVQEHHRASSPIRARRPTRSRSSSSRPASRSTTRPAASTRRETGSVEMLMELAYRLAIEETPFIQTDSQQRHLRDHADDRSGRPR